jgi:hypothetical protein
MIRVSDLVVDNQKKMTLLQQVEEVLPPAPATIFSGTRGIVPDKSLQCVLIYLLVVL